MTSLHDLYEVGGQSPWIDDLKRSYVDEGGLQHLVDLGIRGVTSNPSIMAKSISGGGPYDVQFAELIEGGASVEEAYWDLVCYDVAGAARILRPLYESAGGDDGFVSIEVAPGLAHDGAATESSALELHRRLDAPNVLVKIPATKEGIGAIEAVVGAGHSVNVTLIFSLERYDAVIEAYVRGLEHLVATGGDPSRVASVASFFVSRVDTEIDRRLEAIAAGAPGSARETEALSLRGKAALAQARLAYALYERRFATPRFAALEAAGARRQRPLWASTSTKNPAYPDLLYVEGLIGPGTVNTMPDQTVAAFVDHGHVRRSVDEAPGDATEVIERLAAVGVDLDDVTEQLETEGVASFAGAFDELIASLGARRAELVDGAPSGGK